MDTLKSILTVDKEAWKKEAEEITEHYKMFGDRLPKALADQLDGLKSRLGMK